MGFQPTICTSLRYTARNNNKGNKENKELMAIFIYIYAGWDVEALVNSWPLTDQSAKCSDNTLINRQLVES